MGGSPIVKPITKVIRKVTKPIVETIKPTSRATERRPEVEKKAVKVKKTAPEGTTVSRTKIVRSTRKRNLDTSDQMTQVGSVRNRRKILLGDQGTKLG